MTLLSALRIDVLETFKALKAALKALESCLEQDRELPSWFLPPEELSVNTRADTREQAFHLIQQLEYLDSQKPREILVGAGLIAASQHTIQALIHLNTCKDHFKAAMLALKKTDIKINDAILSAQIEPLLQQHPALKQNHHLEQHNSHHERPQAFASTLKKVGLARLHLKQCYRRIPFFLERPIKVSWTWANTRAITRITIEKARQLLLKQERHAAIEMQLAKLEALSLHEPLAIVQDLAPHLRANVVFREQETESRRVMVKGPVPIFYLADTNEPLPNIRPPGLKRGRDEERRERSDVKLERKPYLPAIRVHRYILEAK